MHVVVGAGGVTGGLIVRELVAAGVPVRAVTRDGRDVGVPGVERCAVDAADAQALSAACAGATVIHHCAMPPLRRWRLDFPALTDAVIAAAESAGARVVYADDTWMYGRVSGPMTVDLPYRPVSDLGMLRAWLAERFQGAAASGRVRLSIVRAGELFGPGVHSVFSGPVFGAVAKGRRPRWLGNPDLPITPTFVADFARTVAIVGRRDVRQSAIWHAPHPAPLTGRRFVELAVTARSDRAGTCRSRRRDVAAVPRGLVRALGLVSPLAREAASLLYQFEQPFVVDGRATTAAFGISPTPYVESVAATVAGRVVDRATPLTARA